MEEVVNKKKYMHIKCVQFILAIKEQIKQRATRTKEKKTKHSNDKNKEKSWVMNVITEVERDRI